MKPRIVITVLLSMVLGSAYAADAMKPSLPGVGLGRAFTQSDGGQLYEAACQVCHMSGGVGAQGAASYPALTKDPRLKAKVFPITRVLNGSKVMPSFREALTDEQIAAVVGYIRTSFGNHYADRVSVDDVKALRQ